MACCSVVQQCYPRFQDWTVVVLFNSATYLFTSYNHRAVGLLPNSSQIFSLNYSTWVPERMRNMAEAIIKALMKALTDIKGSPTDSLKPLAFNWNSSEQFEDFQLFIKGIKSWYTLQGIPDKAGDTTWLEYLLNFLGPIGWRKHEQWNPSGTTAEEWEKNKKLHGSPCFSTMQDIPTGRD